jgi:hypothetical protein
MSWDAVRHDWTRLLARELAFRPAPVGPRHRVRAGQIFVRFSDLASDSGQMPRAIRRPCQVPSLRLDYVIDRVETGFLRQPKRYRRAGAIAPRCEVMVGPPERAEAPFLSVAGSNFRRAAKGEDLRPTALRGALQRAVAKVRDQTPGTC